MKPLDELPVEGPPFPPPDTDTDPPEEEEREPDFPEQDDELYAIGEAWRVMWDIRRERAITDGPITGLLFASVALVYERAEGEPPVCGVLHAIRETIDAWAHNRGQSTLFASVSFADLHLMVRRVDLALAMVRAESYAAKGGA